VYGAVGEWFAASDARVVHDVDGVVRGGGEGGSGGAAWAELLLYETYYMSVCAYTHHTQHN